MEGDGFPFGSAPWAQWGEGRADKVIYLHLSTPCNGWHFHLSLKLHHLAVEPPPRKIKGAGTERTGTDMLDKRKQKSKQIKQMGASFSMRSDYRWGVWECDAVELPNHSSMANRSQISDRSELQLSFIP